MMRSGLLLIYGVLLLLPLVFAAVWGGPARSVWADLGSALGMLALAIILIEFVLSGRFRAISKRIGMDVTMRVHQAMGRVALAFALLHPFMFGGSPSGGPRPWDFTRQLTLSTDFVGMGAGIFAYVLLPTYVIFAVYRTQTPQTYERWRLLHGLGAVVIAIALLVHTIAAGRYAAAPIVAGYWYLLTGAAVATILHVYLIAPVRERNKRWRIEKIAPAARDQWAVTLSPQGHAGMTYKAGQFAWLNIGHSAFSLHENPFSIASAPSAGPDVAFLIKETGDFTRTIGDIPVGTQAYLDGPYGHLTVADRREPGIGLIGGGVGVAPLLAILREMRLSDDPRQVRLIYGCHTADQIAFADELSPDDVTLVLSDPPKDWAGPKGFVDGPFLDQVFSDAAYETWVFMLCGPPAMMNNVEDDLIARGVSPSRILSERFYYD